MTKHVHSELIKAWADGAEIEYYCYGDGTWEDTDSPCWDAVNIYRIKPKSVVKLADVYGTKEKVFISQFYSGDWMMSSIIAKRYSTPRLAKLEFTFSESGELVDCKIVE